MNYIIMGEIILRERDLISPVRTGMGPGRARTGERTMIPTWVDPHWYDTYWYGEIPRRKVPQPLRNVGRRVRALLAVLLSKATTVSLGREDGLPADIIDLSRERLARAAVCRSPRGMP
jgi:hypothetical protein